MIISSAIHHRQNPLELMETVRTFFRQFAAYPQAHVALRTHKSKIYTFTAVRTLNTTWKYFIKPGKIDLHNQIQTTWQDTGRLTHYKLHYSTSQDLRQHTVGKKRIWGTTGERDGWPRACVNVMVSSTGIEYRPGDRPFWQDIPSFPQSLQDSCRDRTLKLGHGRFLPNPFQFIIHYHTFIRRSIVLDTEKKLNKLQINKT
jgi:hypothetical protein